MFGEDKHCARALDFAEHILDAIDKVLALDDKASNNLGRIDATGGELGEMHTRVKKLLGNLLHVDDLGYGANSKTTEMRVEELWLSVGIADYANA